MRAHARAENLIAPAGARTGACAGVCVCAPARDKKQLPKGVATTAHAGACMRRRTPVRDKKQLPLGVVTTAHAGGRWAKTGGKQAAGIAGGWVPNWRDLAKMPPGPVLGGGGAGNWNNRRPVMPVSHPAADRSRQEARSRLVLDAPVLAAGRPATPGRKGREENTPPQTNAPMRRSTIHTPPQEKPPWPHRLCTPWAPWIWQSPRRINRRGLKHFENHLVLSGSVWQAWAFSRHILSRTA